ncbi:galactan 5-O-arabinofuranosyltransferase [Nocardia paucivorans]|uniref:galactan 5-O-arabinofuranosyltransferase n=1 Tax=Nocardia paucivorans TaxID=114259 RepID=UPI0002E7B138|nr:galactan 5-O-arabinofuranosyltransferase [Nocardia paucivorans]
MTTNDRARPGPLVRRAGTALGEALAAAVVATVVTAIGLVAFSQVDWPAFNSSNVTRALTTVGQVVSAVMVAGAIALLRLRRARWMAKLLSWTGIAAFVTVTLGMPLAATKLYLFGVSVDQEFRTEYLTRLTDSPALRDMTYADLPPFYPAGWFWVGGRFANLLGMDGWEAFKPYAIGSIAVAAVIALVLWSQLVRADWAVGVAAAVTAVTVAYASPEAYGAVIAVLLPPVLVMAWGALHRPAEYARDASSRDSGATARGWGAALGTGLFLGLAAVCYTLYFAFAVFTIVLMAVIAAGLAVHAHRVAERVRRRTGGEPVGSARRAALTPLPRLILMGVVAGAIGLIVYLPFLLRLLEGVGARSGTAFHYLPEAGTQLPMPMTNLSLLGGLCLVGTLWLVLRAGSSRRAQSLGIGVLAVYLWSLLSMAATAAGTTLLSFRLEPILLVLLAAAGGFGFVEGARAVYRAFNEPARFRLAAVTVAAIGALAFTQDIPRVLAAEITTAYTDTDGDGVRADRRDPAAEVHYREIDTTLREQTGRRRSDTVVLTGDTTFLAFYPYFGFQGMTSHYANPLADFAARTTTIEEWSELDTPQQLLDAMAAAPWRAPDAFLFRRSGENYTLRLTEDVYPNDPNVRRFTVAFPRKIFADPRFTSTDIGPFTLVVVRDR